MMTGGFIGKGPPNRPLPCKKARPEKGESMQKINSCIFKLIRIAFEHILLTTFLALMVCGQAKKIRIRLYCL